MHREYVVILTAVGFNEFYDLRTDSAAAQYLSAEYQRGLCRVIAHRRGRSIARHRPPLPFLFPKGRRHPHPQNGLRSRGQVASSKFCGENQKPYSCVRGAEAHTALALWERAVEGMPMSNETELVSEADCVLCRDLDPDQRLLMRADLLEIPLREPVCDQCLRAWAVNLGFGSHEGQEASHE
jgi:hypothetical protein